MIAGSESYLWGWFFDNTVIQTIPLPKITGREAASYNAENSVRAVSPQKTVVYINEDLQA